MKLFILLLCITLTVALVPAPQPAAALIANHPAYPSVNAIPVPPQATLAQDLRELKLLFPGKEFRNLIRRYLLNDAEFQGIIRIVNSYEAFMAGRCFLRSPEVIQFRAKMRLLALSSDEDLFSSEELELFNKSPYWANSVYGWQGFINEFLMIYPEYAIQQTIQTKVQQSPAFADFWRQIQALGPAFNRCSAAQPAQHVVMQLQEGGVDTVQMEGIIRNLFNWAPPTVASPAAQGANAAAP